MPFISLCYLIAEAKTSNTMLNNSWESVNPCLVPDLRGKALFFPIEDDISIGLFIYSFMISRYAPSIPTFLRIFIKKNAVFCQMFYLHLLRGSYGSCPFFY